MLDIIIPVFTTLFVTIDPLGIIPVFISLTNGSSERYKHQMAIKSCIIGFCVLTAFAIAGKKLFSLLGIDIPAFRIGGGIMLFIIALEMVFEKRTDRREDSANKINEATHDDISVFPLAIPLIAGPGSITSLFLFTSHYGDNVVSQGIVIAVMLGVVFITYLAFYFSTIIDKALGKTITNILSRIFGIILVAMSVQFIIDGIKEAIL